MFSFGCGDRIYTEDPTVRWWAWVDQGVPWWPSTTLPRQLCSTTWFRWWVDPQEDVAPRRPDLSRSQRTHGWTRYGWTHEWLRRTRTGRTFGWTHGNGTWYGRPNGRTPNGWCDGQSWNGWAHDEWNEWTYECSGRPRHGRTNGRPRNGRFHGWSWNGRAHGWTRNDRFRNGSTRNWPGWTRRWPRWSQRTLQRCQRAGKEQSYSTFLSITLAVRSFINCFFETSFKSANRAKSCWFTLRCHWMVSKRSTH